MKSFGVRFVVLLVVAHVLLQLVVWPSSAFEEYLAFSTNAAAWLLRPIETAAPVGTMMFGEETVVDVRRGCDGLQGIAIYLSAVLAFPVGVRARLVGIAAGVAFLVALNLVRIATLFLARRHYPELFETLHVTVWQALFLFLAMVLWSLWARWSWTRWNAVPDRTTASSP